MTTPIISRIYLVGPRASGKTTVGKKLATSLGFRFADTDDVLTQMAKRTVEEIVEQEGWEGFRDKESAVLTALSEQQGIIIATGGGMVLREANRDMMRSRGKVFWLQVPVETVISRLESDPLTAQRPSLTGKSITDEIEEIMKERQPLYHDAAHHELDATQPVQTIIDSMKQLLENDSNMSLCKIKK